MVDSTEQAIDMEKSLRETAPILTRQQKRQLGRTRAKKVAVEYRKRKKVPRNMARTICFMTFKKQGKETP